MNNRIRTQSAAFLAATFGLTWALWFGAYFDFASASSLLILLGTAVPSAMGVIFTAVLSGKSELKALVHSVLRVKAPPKWWFYAILLFPVVLLCACVVFMAAGGSLPDARFPIWFLPLAFFYIFACMGPLGEELGWRGFLLKRLLPRWGTVKAGLVLGLVWSAWHLPLFLLPGTIQHELGETGLFLTVPGYFLYTVCISLLMVVLYEGTGGSLLLCMVFHTVCNLSLGAAPIILIRSGATVLLAALIFTTVVVLKRRRLE